MFATLLAAEEPLTARSESEPSLSPVGLLWVLGRAIWQSSLKSRAHRLQPPGADRRPELCSKTRSV